MFALGLALMFTAAFLGMAVHDVHKQTVHWDGLMKAKAASSDFRFIPAQGWGTYSRLEGQLGGMPIVIDRYMDNQEDSSNIYTRVQASPDIPTELDIRAEHFGHKLLSMVGATDLQIGDPAFDDQFRLAGSEAHLRARLDAASRDSLLQAQKLRVAVKDGVVSVESNDLPTAQLINTLLAEAPRVAATLQRANLEQTALHERVPLVQARALRVLAETRLAQARHVALELLGGREPVEALHQDLVSTIAAVILLTSTGRAADVAAMRAQTLPHPDLQEFLERGIAGIQQRLGNRAAGGLSVSEGQHEGALSVTQQKQPS